MRRAGAIAALLACIAYTMLTTWHGLLMQRANAAALTPEAALELALKAVICHGGAGEQAALPDAAPTQSPSPDQSSDCPVCKGLAACHFALLIAAELGLLAPVDAAEDFGWLHETGSGRSNVVPRSRGPPLPV